MRLTQSKAAFLKNAIREHLVDASIYLFGSRVHDDQRGGDIDILVIGKRKLTNQEKRNVVIAFHKKFGEQKIDIVSYPKTDDANFKHIALADSIEL